MSGLPTDGRTIYVRLWSHIGGGWQYEDYSYKANTGLTEAARLTKPEPGTTLTSTTVTFHWTAGGGVSRIVLYVGTTGVGSYDLLAEIEGAGPAGRAVPGLPGDGRTIYVRLWSLIGGGWQFNDYIYRANTGRAQLMTPPPRSTLTSSSETFGWTVGEGVTQTALYVGIGGVGSYDIYSAVLGTSGSATVTGLPVNGATVYVRLWSKLGEEWQYGDYTYFAKK